MLVLLDPWVEVGLSERGRDAKQDEHEKNEDRVLDLELEGPEPPREEIRLDRDEALRDLRELQELSVEREAGRHGRDETDS